MDLYDYNPYQRCYVTKDTINKGSATQPDRSFTVELIQNCDLPPPQKSVFLARRPKLPSSTSKIIREKDVELPVPSDKLSSKEKLDLLRALQLSQTRARSAENKTRRAKQDTENLTTLLLEESLQLFAHRQWVKILEVEVLNLQSLKSQKQKQQQTPCSNSHNIHQGRIYAAAFEGGSGGGENEDSWFTWYMTLALCFGIAGVGFAFGCRCLF